MGVKISIWTYEMAGANSVHLTTSIELSCLWVRPCCPTASLPHWHPDPDFLATYTLTNSYFASGFPFGLRQAQNTAVRAVCSKKHCLGVQRGDSLGQKGLLRETCSLWLYLLQHCDILKKESYHYPFLPSGGERQV